VALAFTACAAVALSLREWERSTISEEFLMRLLKIDPHGPSFMFSEIASQITLS
jgi:hypothetical protein